MQCCNHYCNKSTIVITFVILTIIVIKPLLLLNHYCNKLFQTFKLESTFFLKGQDFNIFMKFMKITRLKHKFTKRRLRFFGCFSGPFK